MKYSLGDPKKGVIITLSLLSIIWIIFWLDHVFVDVDFYKYGVHPHDWKQWYGPILMPLLHNKDGFEHIVNNSTALVVLVFALYSYYNVLFLRVMSILWLGSGVGVWLFAGTEHSYHIGFSGVIYGLAAFLFVSGVLRKYTPLQAISLFVLFVYGSLIWGVFPMQSHVSWQGHAAGTVLGILLAFVYRKKGPQRRKYGYEIEKELGIPPPDLEGIYNHRLMLHEQHLEREEQKRKDLLNKFKVIYHYRRDDEG